MRLTLSIHGGIAAGIACTPRSVDTGRLSPEEATTLCCLADDALKAAKKRPAEALPDAFTYRITIEDGEHSHVLEQGDAWMTPEFYRLLDKLEQVVREEDG